MKEIAKAFLEYQRKMRNPVKDKANDFYKTAKNEAKYATLNEHLRVAIPLLNECGLIIIQPITQIDGIDYVHTQLIHCESGEKFESFAKILYQKNFSTPVFVKARDGEKLHSVNEAQTFGAGITYTRRYSLASMLGLDAVDDDANSSWNESESYKNNNIKIEETFKNIGAKKMNDTPTNFESPNETLAEKTGLINKVKSLKTEYALQFEQINAMIQERYNVKNSSFLTVSQLKDLIDFINSEFGGN